MDKTRLRADAGRRRSILAWSRNRARDHNRFAFTGWVAGGGFKRGFVHGATDDLGFSVVSGKVHVHDLHATLLHQLGIDHTS